jgi:hypothetical protein
MTIHFRCLFVIGVVLLSLSCKEKLISEQDATDSFTIYISDGIYDGGTIRLDTLKLLQPTFLSISDITSYSWSNHTITYSDSVWERLKTWGNLLHKIFVVAVGDERIYWGIFIDIVDSGGCQNPVIHLLPRHPDGRNTIPKRIFIDRAYPEYFGDPDDPDPREDPRIYEALEGAGILIP